jgi:DnaK suppressor protein
MTQTELNEFRAIFANKQAELGYRDQGRSALAIEANPDALDQIQDSQDRDLAIRVIDRNSTLSGEVRAAIRRLDGGNFGICVECENEIGKKRLAALPWTSSCIECQRAADSLAA